MMLRVVYKGLWTIYALQKGERCELLEFLTELDSTARAGVLSMFEKVANSIQGPHMLPKDVCHHVDPQKEILEFVKGQVRILWFYDTNKIIICSHAFKKKTQKTPKKEQKKALNNKREYFKQKS